MERIPISFTARPQAIQLRSSGQAVFHEIPVIPTNTISTPPPFPVEPRPAPEPDLRPLLNNIASAVAEVEQRRQQSLEELQQVAIELSIAVASQLVFEALDRDQLGVENLVKNAISSLGLDQSCVIFLNPVDLDLLKKRLAKTPSEWNTTKIQLMADPGLARGGCRAESPDGRMVISEITSRLSEIRRHWMEELDDSQIERRRAAGEGPALRRFPDRRETA